MFPVLLCLALLSPLDDPPGPKRVAAEVQPTAPGVGRWFASVKAGERRLPRPLTSETRAVVVIARNAECPLCRKYGPAIARLEERYREQPVEIFHVWVNGDTDDDAKRDRDRHGFTSPGFVDESGELTRAFGLRTTTEVLVFDADSTLRYRGALDDQHGIGFSRPTVERAFAIRAIDALLTGRPIPNEATTAPGCVLDSGEPTAAKLDTVTYHDRVSRIVRDHCVSCHRPEGAGPFSLASYQDLKKRKSMVAFVLEDDLMPPWFAAHGGPFENDPSLSPEEKSDFLAWLKSDLPAGHPARGIGLPEQPDGWKIGTPDLIVSVPDEEQVPAEGVMPYRYQYVQVPGDADRWVSAMEIRPSAPEVVHHILVFLEEPPKAGESRRDMRRRWQGGLRGYFAGMVPGQTATYYPTGLAKKLPAGAWLKFQIHYTPNGTATRDRTRIGLVFADGEPPLKMLTRSAVTTRFRIPPGVDNHAVKASYRFRNAGNIYSFAPHVHLRGKAFRYELELPDGSRDTVLDIPRYDFNWQLRYRLEEPISVPPGAVLHATAWYDNSPENPANPDSTRSVRFGEQTFDKMMIGYFEWYRATPPAQ